MRAVSSERTTTNGEGDGTRKAGYRPARGLGRERRAGSGWHLREQPHPGRSRRPGRSWASGGVAAVAARSRGGCGRRPRALRNSSSKRSRACGSASMFSIVSRVRSSPCSSLSFNTVRARSPMRRRQLSVSRSRSRLCSRRSPTTGPAPWRCAVSVTVRDRPSAGDRRRRAHHREGTVPAAAHLPKSSPKPPPRRPPPPIICPSRPPPKGSRRRPPSRDELPPPVKNGSSKGSPPPKGSPPNIVRLPHVRARSVDAALMRRLRWLPEQRAASHRRSEEAGGVRGSFPPVNHGRLRPQQRVPILPAVGILHARVLHDASCQRGPNMAQNRRATA